MTNVALIVKFNPCLTTAGVTDILHPRTLAMTPRGKAVKPILLKGAKLVDPSTDRDSIGDILIEGTRISKVGRNIKPGDNVELVDCRGYIICPSFCDAHVHLRTPGQEKKENVITGCRAAARGGVTTVVTMPNTNPPVDTPQRVESLLKRYKREGSIDLHIAGAVTKKLRSSGTTDFEGIINAGAIALTNDGKWVSHGSHMRKALEFSKRLDVLILSHAEKSSLHNKGCINRGKVSRSLKVPGIPTESETEAIKRDLKLAKAIGGRLHVQHLSTARGIALIRKAKKKGIAVTCEVTPHHLLLTEDAVRDQGTQAMMNPPLRTERDRKALIEGLKDGTIDIIATDHAPHTPAEKRRELKKAPFGVTGLETLFSSLYTELVCRGVITLLELVGLITCKPRSLFGLENVSLKQGSRADIVIIDPDSYWEVKTFDFESKGKNSPFIGREFAGKVIRTIHKGKTIYKGAKTRYI